MPPAVTRAFGFEGTTSDGESVVLDKYGGFRFKGGDQQLEDGRAGKKFAGLGRECGFLPDPETGEKVDAGKMLMRGQWNADLFGPLKEAFEEGRKMGKREDAWVHKNRMSGLWGGGTDLEKFLEREGLRTLFFTGVCPYQRPRGSFDADACPTGEHGSVCWRHISRRFQQRSVFKSWRSSKKPFDREDLSHSITYSPPRPVR